MKNNITFPSNILKSTLPSLYHTVTINAEVAQCTYDASLVTALSYLNHGAHLCYQVSTTKNRKSNNISLFTILIAGEGEGKDTIHYVYSTAQQQYKQELKEKRNRQISQLNSARQIPDKKKREEELATIGEVLQPTIVTDSVTSEGVKRGIAFGYPHQAIFSTEGGGVLEGYAFRPERAISALTTFSKLKQGNISGEILSSIMTKEQIEAAKFPDDRSNISFSICMALQPLIFSEFVQSEKIRTQGFLGRCLLVTPPSTAGIELPDADYLEDAAYELKQQFSNIVTKLYNNVRYNDSKEQILYKNLSLSEEDLKRLNKFKKHFIPCNAYDSAFSEGASFSKKLPEHVLCLAGTLQAYRNMEEERRVVDGLIDSDILTLSMHLAEYYHQHYLNTINYFVQQKSHYTELKKLASEDPETYKFYILLRRALKKANINEDHGFQLKAALFRGVSHKYQNTHKAIKKLYALGNYGIIIHNKKQDTYSFVDLVDSTTEPYPSFFNPPAPTEPDPDDTPPDTEPSPPEPVTKPVAPSSKLPQQTAADSSSFLGEKPVIDTNQFTSTPPSRSSLEKEQIRASIRIEDYVRTHYQIHAHDKINCPFHDDKTPSCQINYNKQNIHCYSCNESWDIFALIAKQNNLDNTRDFQQILEIAASFAGISSCSNANARRVSPAKVACDNSYNIDAAQRLYGEAKESREHKYLNARLGQLCPHTPALRYTTYRDPVLKESYPAMVLPLFHGNSVLGAHITLLTPDGAHKAHISPAKKMLGKTKGGYIPLFSGEEGDTSLLVAEGIETAIAAKIQLGFTGYVIAAGSSANLPDVEITSEIRSVIIASDNDEAGMQAAGKLYNRLREAGVEVGIRNPNPEYNDFCEELVNKNKG